MSVSSRHGRTPSSPPRSTYSQALTVGQQKTNVVTRLAIEGKAKRGEEGASIRMYLKISLPLETITNGGTIALFPEENLKILDSQVHPLDNNSVPYNFSSTTSPLLHRAAGALNLPARSSQSYVPTDGSAGSAPLDDKYTGHILVSGYYVSYVLPKEYPRRDHENLRGSRRGSISMNFTHFMAAIDMWAPFLSQPPHAPFLLSLPVPRCLSNQIKLRIFPPSSISSSMASLSSNEEDSGSWELTSDPHVTLQKPKHLSRTPSYTHFADDESSDASTSAGFADGCGLQGTFPSTDRLRVRWAAPMKPGQIAEAVDGRRRVGVREVKADITCTVLSKNKGKSRSKRKEGLLIRLDYTATCKGVWFPGVATLLGMDVGLDAGDYNVSWASGPELKPKWTVTGGTGFTGFAVGKGPAPSVLHSSPEASTAVLPSLSTPKIGMTSAIPVPPSRQSSTSSASLLNAPLPAENVADYSFESSPTSTPTGTFSSFPSSPERRRSRSRSRSRSRAQIDKLQPQTDTDIEEDVQVQPPKMPITVHLNMNDLQAPPKNVFTFSISGVVRITPPEQHRPPVSRNSSPSQSQSPSEDESDVEPVVLPTFRVLYAEKESITTVIRSEVDGATVDVFNSSGDVRNAQTRKTVLQKGGHIKCGTDGARVAIRAFSPSFIPSIVSNWLDESSDNSARRSRSYYRSPKPNTSRLSASVLRTPLLASRLLQQDGPLKIPFVNIDITPLGAPDAVFLDSYAVHVTLPAPSNDSTEWLEFGLALPSPDTSSPDPKGKNKGVVKSNPPPQVNVASASVEGVSVRFETSLSARRDSGVSGLGMSFEELSGKDWITWVKVYVGDLGGGKVDVVYLVNGTHEDSTTDEKSVKGKQIATDPTALDILLPSFSLSVGRLEVNIQMQAGYELLSLRTNLAHQQSIPQGRKLLHYSMEEFFYPRLSMSIASSAKPEKRVLTAQALWRLSKLLAFILPSIAALFLFVNLHLLTTELHEVKQSIQTKDVVPDIIETVVDTAIPETVTVISTVLADTPHKWWFSPDTETGTETTILSTTAEYVTVSSMSSMSSMPSMSSPTSTLSVPSLHLRPSVTTATSPTTTPSTVRTQDSALIPIHDLLRAWPLHFELPPLAVPSAMRETMTSMYDSLQSVWYLFRKVLHYPLDPP